MSVRVGSRLIWALAVCLVGLLIFFGGCKSSQAVEARAEIDVYRQISDLDEKRQGLEKTIQQQKNDIRALAEEHGAGHLDSRLELQVQRVAALMEEIVKIESDRTKLEVEVEIFESIESKSADQVKRLEDAQIQLRLVRTYESRMRDMLAKEDAAAVELGRRKLALDDLKEQLIVDKQELEKVTQAILGLDLEPAEDKPAKKWPW